MKVKGEKFELDEKDKKILNLLLKDSRITFTQISNKIGLSVDAVRNRIKKLENKGIIVGYTSILSYRTLGYSLKASILIKLQNLTEKKLEEFMDFLKKKNQIIVLNSVAGNFDIEIIVVAEDSEDLENLSKEIRSKFTEILDNWQTNIITKTHQIEKFEV